MVCCEQLRELEEREMLRVGPVHTLRDGRIINEVDTEYFLRFGAERANYVGIHYCPFCGRVVSKGLWNLEKKKQGF